MVRWLALLAIPVLLQADERWVEIHRGPFIVLSAAGDKAAREQMNQLVQFRFETGAVLGKPEAHLLWPLTVLISKKGKPVRVGPHTSISLARNTYVVSTTEDALLSEARLAELARLLIEQNTSRLPDDIESGIIAALSTAEISGPKILLGAPPAERTRAWARMRMLLVRPEYAGRSRVMISNLEQGAGLEVAYRNAFEKSSAQLEKQTDEELAGHTLLTNTFSGQALSPQRDLHPQTEDADVVQLAEADLLLASGSPEAEAAYTALHGAGAAEGLGLLALAADRDAEGKRLLDSCIESGSKNARAFFLAGLLEKDEERGKPDLQKAAELNPLWGEPPYRLALLEPDLNLKAALLKKATQLDPRNTDYWKALAKNETEANRFVEAQKAWGGAERAAANQQEREGIRKIRLDLEGRRADEEAAERRRRAEEEARDLQRVKDASMASIHAAEASANKKFNPDGAAPPVATEWWSNPEGSAKVQGELVRFDCLNKQARLVMRDGDGKSITLLVRNPAQLAVSASGPSEAALACGVQKPPRKALVLYNPKVDHRTGTAGEAVSVELR